MTLSAGKVHFLASVLPVLGAQSLPFIIFLKSDAIALDDRHLALPDFHGGVREAGFR